MECHSLPHCSPSLKPCKELQSPPQGTMDSLDSLVSSCLFHKPFFQSCHISLIAAYHGLSPKCSLVLTDLLRPVPRMVIAPSEALGDSFLEPVLDCHSQGAPVDILRGQSKTSCNYYNKKQQSQRQHNSHAYSACHHLTEMLKILRADGPQLCQETRN